MSLTSMGLKLPQRMCPMSDINSRELLLACLSNLTDERLIDQVQSYLDATEPTDEVTMREAANRLNLSEARLQSIKYSREGFPEPLSKGGAIVGGGRTGRTGHTYSFSAIEAFYKEVRYKKAVKND